MGLRLGDIAPDFEQSSSITTENLAFDGVTGEALLTKTTNEFNDSFFLFGSSFVTERGGFSRLLDGTKESKPRRIAKHSCSLLAMK